MLPGMEDIYRRHLQGLTRTAREADACADAHYGRAKAGRNIATVTASEAAPGAPESVSPVNSPSPTT
jgi:hypothetical protein